MKFIDFGTIGIGHPAQDFWYFIYTSTDSNWRKQHLETCYEMYFNSLTTYLKKAEIDITFDAFKHEFNNRRLNSISVVAHDLTILLNPFPTPYKKWKKFVKWRYK